MKDIAYEEFIERLREESDIIAIISEYVSLKKNGKNYWVAVRFTVKRRHLFQLRRTKAFLLFWLSSRRECF